MSDAYTVKNVLERHADGTVNFATPRLLVGTSPAQQVQRRDLRGAVKDLFASKCEVALFYFAGHGYIDVTGGYLCGSECRSGEDGLALSEVMTFANQSPAENKIVILDSCHSGIAGDRSTQDSAIEISEGTTILTASAADQYAIGGVKGGVFTSLFIDALNGSAANLMGDVTPGSVYAHIDQSLGPWAQRPLFKTNVRQFVSLRETPPPIAISDLQALPGLFPTDDYAYPLDPTYEPERSPEQLLDPAIPAPIAANNAIFKTLQNCVRVNLVRPVDAPHMWHAAMQSTACELTVLGQHYRQLATKGLI